MDNKKKHLVPYDLVAPGFEVREWVDSVLGTSSAGRAAKEVDQ